MIIGKQPFLSIRISGKYVYGQIQRATQTGDITLCAASSRDLSQKFGWKGSSKSIPGAYLTGFYLGQLANQKKIESLVVYSGVGRFVHGSRLSSLVAGVKEAGVNIEIDEKSLPDKSRLSGEHIAGYAKSMETEDKESFERTFSGLIRSGLNPADYPTHFEETKSIISKNPSRKGKQEQ